MADVTMRFDIDVSEVKKKLKSLENTIQKTKLSPQLDTDITQQIEKLQKNIEKASTFKLNMETDEKTMKEYKSLMKVINKDSKELGDILKQANDQIVNRIGLTKQEIKKIKEVKLFEEGINNAYEKRKRKIQELKNIEMQKRGPGLSGKDVNLGQSAVGLIARMEKETDKEKNKLLLERISENKTLYKVYQQILKLKQEEKELEEDYKKGIEEVRKRKDTGQTFETELASLDSYKKASRATREEFERMSEAEKKSYNDMSTAAKAKEEATKKVGTSIGDLGQKLKRLAEYAIAAWGLRQLRQFAQATLTFIRDLDKSLTEIATVTGRTREEMWKMADEFNRMGRELGRTTNEVAQASVIFYRQGLKTAEVMEMVRASTVSAGIAGIETADASDKLTSALKGFLLPATEAMDVADTFAALAAQSASSFHELSYALSKTAASAHVAGIDIDHMSAYLSKVIEATRYAIAA